MRTWYPPKNYLWFSIFPSLFFDGMYMLGLRTIDRCFASPEAIPVLLLSASWASFDQQDHSIQLRETVVLYYLLCFCCGAASKDISRMSDIVVSIVEHCKGIVFIDPARCCQQDHTGEFTILCYLLVSGCCSFTKNMKGLVFKLFFSPEIL